MFVLIMGYSKAGKSRYAEKLADSLKTGPLLYVATMIPVGEGEEGAACVQRHRAQRAGYDFETIERPVDVAGIGCAADATVLLEDVSNLLANNLFGPGEGERAAAYSDIIALRQKCENLVAVTFHGLTPSDEYDMGTNRYINELALLNSELVQVADAVVMLENGTPRAVKGALPL